MLPPPIATLVTLTSGYDRPNSCSVPAAATAAAACTRPTPTTIDRPSEPLTQGEPQPHQSQQLSSKAMSTDPFYVFRDDLYRQLERVDEALAEYLRVVHQTVGFTRRRSGRVNLDRLLWSVAAMELTFDSLSIVRASRVGLLRLLIGFCSKYPRIKGF
jgi:hypothetical protein